MAEKRVIKQFSMRTRIKNPTHKLGGINIWCFFLEQPTQPLKQIQIRLGSKNSPIGTLKIEFVNLSKFLDKMIKMIEFGDFFGGYFQIFYKNLHQVLQVKIASL